MPFDCTSSCSLLFYYFFLSAQTLHALSIQLEIELSQKASDTLHTLCRHINIELKTFDALEICFDGKNSFFFSLKKQKNKKTKTHTKLSFVLFLMVLSSHTVYHGEFNF